MKKSAIDKPFVKKLLRTIDHGLTHGVGNGGEGHMCVQHAVNYVAGRVDYEDPIYDEKADDVKWCVLPEIAQFGIELNDSSWSSDKARAEGLRRLAVAELGSKGMNKRKLAARIRTNFIEHMVPQLDDDFEYEFESNSLEAVLEVVLDAATNNFGLAPSDCLLGLAADVVTNSLAECGSGGSEYLNLADAVKAIKDAKT